MRKLIAGAHRVSEKGTIPPGFPLAFVCMAIGGNASFMYMTGGSH
jgi:hypothetical protein